MDWGKAIMNRKPLLMKPISYFTKDFNQYFKLHSLSAEKETLPYFESEAVIIYITEGEGVITINGLDFPVQKGTFCLLHSYHVFQIKPKKGRELKYYALVYDYPLAGYMAFGMDVLSDNREETFDTTPVIQLDAEDEKRVEAIFATFEAEDAIHDCSSVLIKTALYSRLHIIYIKAAHSACNKEKMRMLPLAWRLLLFLTKYNYMPITSKSVSEYFQISITELNRELRSITGYNFSYLLNRARINFAGASLLLQDVSLRMVAAYSGFNTESAFFRAFKRCKGMTPNEYRNSMIDKKLWNPRKFIYEAPHILLQYILANFRYPITIQQAEEELYMTQDNIKSIMREYYHISFHELLTECRIKFAKSLLSTTTLPVCDIAFSSGFNNVNTYIRLFKKEYQITPNQYRLENGVKNGQEIS